MKNSNHVESILPDIYHESSSDLEDENQNEQNQPLPPHIFRFVRKLSCEHCKRDDFKNNDELLSHTCDHVGLTVLHPCEYCEKVFSTKSTLTIHTRLHTGEKLFECKYCSKYFTNFTNYQKHVRNHTGEKPYKCQQCEKAFTCQADLSRHNLSHSTEKPYKCQHCSKSFLHKNVFNRHVFLHSGKKPYTCQYCPKSFSEKSYLKAHTRTHTGEKPYVCQHCSRRFGQTSSYYNHLRCHSDEKPYQCDYCQQFFKRRDNLTRHIRLMHIRKKEGQNCEKDLKSSNLANCKRIGTNKKKGLTQNADKKQVKPNKCKHCSKEFMLQIALNKHVCHRKEVLATYKCDHCDKVFAHEAYLHRHMLTHNAGEKFAFEQCYACLYCREKLSSKNRLLDHMNRHCLA